MPFSKSRRQYIGPIKIALTQYQNQVIINHCQACLRPCCKLTDVVLEFDWRHLCRLYRIDLGQKAFDRSLRDGSGPVYIRKQAGRYYTHGSPCPAYDIESRRCGHYHSRSKPESCSDFPVYLDDRTIVADTRCEALDADDLLCVLKETFPRLEFKSRRHPDFPVLHYIDFIPCTMP